MIVVSISSFKLPFLPDVQPVKAQSSQIRYGCEVQSYRSSALTYFTPSRVNTYAEDWGFNTVQFQDIFWCQIERSYANVGVYNEGAITALHTMVDRCTAEGLIVQLAFFVDFDDGENEDSRTWWDGWASHEYAIYGEGKVNHDWDYDTGNYGEGTADIWATGGKERYGNFLVYMAEEFNDCTIIVNKFPWHSAPASSSDYDEWSQVAFPYYLERIRSETSNHEPVVFVPVHQDSNRWHYQNEWYDDPYGVILGLGHLVHWDLDGGYPKDTTPATAFTSAYKSYTTNKLVGAWQFRNNFPNEQIMSIEFGGISAKPTQRPIADFRLDALEWALESLYNLSAGYIYHTLSWKVGWDTILNGQPSSNTMIPEPNIFALLQEWRLPEGEPPQVFNAWSSGFETGDLSEWDYEVGSCAVTSSYAHNGTYSANLTGTEGTGGWLSGWDKRVKFTVDHNDFDETVTNYPLYVHICGTSAGQYNEDVSFIFDEVGSNYYKMAITTSDGTTECHVNIEYWDSSAECSRMWLGAPSISHTTDTAFYYYYDNDHADNTEYVHDTGSGNSINVWDNDYMMVNHMTGASYSALVDATRYGNNVTGDNGTPDYNVGGRCAKAVNFEADSTEYLVIDDSDTLDGFDSAMTLEVWAKFESLTDRELFAKYHTSGDQRSYYCQLEDSTTLRMAFSEDGSTYVAYDFTGQTFTTGSWYYIVFIWLADSEPKAFVDGTQLTTSQYEKTATGWTTSGIYASTQPLRLGYTIHNSQKFDGVLDEPKLSNTSRESLIDSNYEVQRDMTIDWYTEESSGGSGQYASLTHVIAPMSELYARTCVRLEDLPDTSASGIKVLEFETVGGILIGAVMVYVESGIYYWAVQVGGENWDEGNRTASTINADTFYCVVMYANATANGNFSVWVNNELKCEDLGDYSGLGTIQKVAIYCQLYNQASSKTVYHDYFAVDDEMLNGGHITVFKVNLAVYGLGGLPNVVINGTYTTDEYGFCEIPNLTFNQYYKFIIAKPSGYHPFYCKYVQGSYLWNDTHYVLSHFVAENYTQYVKIYFQATEGVYISSTSIGARVYSFTHWEGQDGGDVYLAIVSGEGYIAITNPVDSSEPYLLGYGILPNGIKIANVQKGWISSTQTATLSFTGTQSLTLCYTKNESTSWSANTWFWLNTYDTYVVLEESRSFSTLHRSNDYWYFGDYYFRVTDGNLSIIQFFTDKTLKIDVATDSTASISAQIPQYEGQPVSVDGVVETWAYDESAGLLTVSSPDGQSTFSWKAKSGEVEQVPSGEPDIVIKLPDPLIQLARQGLLIVGFGLVLVAVGGVVASVTNKKAKVERVPRGAKRKVSRSPRGFTGQKRRRKP